MPTTVQEQGRKAEIRRRLVESQARLQAALDRAEPDGWVRPSPNQGWTVRHLVTHLATAEAGFVQSLTRMAAGGGGVPADFDPDRWNAGQLRRREGTPPEQLRGELAAAHRQLLALLDGLADSALDQRGRLTTGGEGSLEDGFRLAARHKQAHTADIEAALA